MDNELIALCNEIYQTHKKAFDLIFENRNDNTKLVSDTCKQKLEDYSKNNEKLGIKIDESSTKSYIKFRTTKLIEDFQGLNTCFYYYQIEIRPSNEDVTVVMKLVFHQEKNNPLESQWIDKMNKWIDKKSLEIGKNWEWKTAWASSVLKVSDVNDTDIERWLKQCLKLVSEKENII